MEIISKISKGSKMDQVYIPKNRVGFSIGSYVVLKPMQETESIKKSEAPFFYNLNYIEPIKLALIKDIFSELDQNIDSYENILITGSFLDKGFNFNDVDIIVITENIDDNPKLIADKIEKKTGIKPHLILISHTALIEGLSTDPLYQSMLSKCISKKRFVYSVKRNINYKLLDLHLLKSKLLADNFNVLNGRDKYELVRNAVSIYLFIENKKVSKENIEAEINKLFGKGMSSRIKDNLITDKEEFLEIYIKFYDKLFLRILEGIKNGTKQKQAD